MDIKKKTCKRLQRHNNKANVGSNTTDQSVYTRSTSDGNKCSLDDTMPLLAKRQLLTHSHPINLSSTDATKCITSKNRYESTNYINILCAPCYEMYNNYMQQLSFNINNDFSKNNNIHYTKSTAFHLKKFTLHIR